MLERVKGTYTHDMGRQKFYRKADKYTTIIKKKKLEKGQ